MRALTSFLNRLDVPWIYQWLNKGAPLDLESIIKRSISSWDGISSIASLIGASNPPRTVYLIFRLSSLCPSLPIPLLSSVT